MKAFSAPVPSSLSRLLAMRIDFYYATNPDGYEALYALRELFAPHTEKRKIIDFLISEEEEAEKSVKQSEF